VLQDLSSQFMHAAIVAFLTNPILLSYQQYLRRDMRSPEGE